MSPVSSDNKKSDEYWMGVRDALRMIDSFNKWAKRNPHRAKSLEDFIDDGLIAAAKRCESCLSEKLGLSFVVEDTENQDYDEIPVVEEESQDFEITPVFDESPKIEDDKQEYEEMESSFGISIDEESAEFEPEPKLVTEQAEEFEVETPSVDGVERSQTEVLDKIDTEGPPRDFTRDFSLVEPPQLVVEESTHEEEPIDTETFDDELKTDVEMKSEEDYHAASSFTWSDYKTAIAPSPEIAPSEYKSDILPSMEGELDEELPEDTELSEPPEPPMIWKSSSESPVPDDDEEDVSMEELQREDIEDSESTGDIDAKEKTAGPPPPPPPPESEEDEEERKRRARRLFFGA